MMEKYPLPPCCYRVSVKALIFDETRTKVVMFKEHDGTRSFPGGGLERGEEPKAEMQREINEEAGLTMTRMSDKPIDILFRKKIKKGLRLAQVLYEVKVKDLDLTPSKECEEIRFFTKQEIVDMHKYADREIAKLPL